MTASRRPGPERSGSDGHPRPHAGDVWGPRLLAFALPATAAGLALRFAFLLALGVVAFFTGLWCMAVARVARGG